MRSPRIVRDDHAATPVIGIILMVMVTVLLAAVVGSFALGLTSFVDTGAPAADLEFEHDPAGAGNLTIVHVNGESVPERQVLFRVSDGAELDASDCADGRWAADGETVSAGDVCRLQGIDADDTVAVVWFDRNSSDFVGKWND